VKHLVHLAVRGCPRHPENFGDLRRIQKRLHSIASTPATKRSAPERAMSVDPDASASSR
jgi:hypothetical protein